jgi:hypothetical protein
MPSWKKVITSGSDATLNSLSVTNGITGSLQGSASYAITASYLTGLVESASYSDTTVSASYAITASYALNLGYPGYNATASFTSQSVWTFNHNLGQRLVVIQAFDNAYNQVIPASIILNTTSSATITFPTSESGFVVASIGGATSGSGGNSETASYAFTASYVENAQTASYVVLAQSASYVLNSISASYSNTSSYSFTASYVETAQTASYVVLAQTASFVQNAQSASYVLNAVSASYSTTAATASYVNGSRFKSGIASGSQFAGNPKKYTVNFTNPFETDLGYAITITGESSRTYTIETKVSGSFVINTNSNTAFTNNVYWIASKIGEFNF